MQIIGFSPFGYEGSLVAVEVDLRRGIPAVDLVGLADNAVKEARERMRAAIRNSGFDFPPERVLISLSPADVKKEGAGFDLAIALAVLAAHQQNKEEGSSGPQTPVLVIGELELSGKVRPVRGVHCAVSAALENGIRYCIIPEENAVEAGVFSDMAVFTVKDLTEAWHEYMRVVSVCAEEASRTGLGDGTAAIGGKQSSGGKENAASGVTSKTDANAGFVTGTVHAGNGIGSDVAGNAPAGKKISLFSRSETVEFAPVEENEDFASVSGQRELVRALQIAAAGGHNCMVFGPPGCGKTLAIHRFPSLLPLLSGKDAAEVTRIYSIAGLLPRDVQLIRKPPFRIPHQGASLEGMIGGGVSCSPGEVSLAHNGVLFLDEAAEFRTSVLQSLRVPIENGSVTLSRAGRHTVFPARFQLLVATNPCPCGNYGSPDKVCMCSVKAVEQYWKKFSSPLMDRIDIRCPVFGNAASLVKERASGDKLYARASQGADAASNGLAGQIRAERESERAGLSEQSGRNDCVPSLPDSVSSAELRKDIARAVKTQYKRQGKKNSMLSPEEIQYYCRLSADCRKFLSEAVTKYDFSARAVHSCMKVARTIADMAGSFSIREQDLAEAVSLRKNEGSLDICFASM